LYVVYYFNFHVAVILELPKSNLIISSIGVEEECESFTFACQNFILTLLPVLRHQNSLS